ncbi:MAG TPA: PepSY domain-containing protein [Pseudolabrys sp.]|nr:PepSY domain-containing protein [Pseudolabrys sp.]
MFAATVAAAVAVPPNLAAARDRDDLRREEVRRAVETGEIRSLAEIIATVRGKLPGEVLGMDIDWKGGRWRYEFRVVDGQGRLFDVYIDARNGEIERIKEK